MPSSSIQPSDAHRKLLADILQRSAHDSVLRERLLADATATLKAEGFFVADGTTVTAVQNTASQTWLLLPPGGQDLSDADLDAVAGGKTNTRKFISPFDEPFEA